jgi:hypothetical protein
MLDRIVLDVRVLPGLRDRGRRVDPELDDEARHDPEEAHAVVEAGADEVVEAVGAERRPRARDLDAERPFVVLNSTA